MSLSRRAFLKSTAAIAVASGGLKLFGLGEVYRRTGERAAAAEATRRLDKAWAGEKSALDLSRL